jgi:hypothetical protein
MGKELTVFLGNPNGSGHGAKIVGDYPSIGCLSV